ncbi:MAG: sensor histidine kinase [Rhodospirillaceae bacterium]
MATATQPISAKAKLLITSGKIALGLLAAIGLVVLYMHLERRALANVRSVAASTLDVHVEATRSWVNQYRALAPILSRHPQVISTLQAQGTAARAVLSENLNWDLLRWTNMTGALDTYVLDRNGLTIAASNWTEPHSFVGQNYAYRPYFKAAMDGRLGRFFALGTRSGVRGYYFSFPVRQNREIIGAVVVKVGVDGLERDLRNSINILYIEDENGVVILAGPKDFRLTKSRPIPEAEAATLRLTRQFDPDSLNATPIRAIAGGSLSAGGRLVQAPTPVRYAQSSQVLSAAEFAEPQRTPGRVSEWTEWLHLSQAMPVEGWRVHILAPTQAARTGLLTSMTLALTAILFVLSLLWIFWQRRRTLMERMAHQAETSRMLEETVRDRTAELSAAVDRLRTEMSEKVAAQKSLTQAEAELAQSSKLAALGQMSAALSHEFNQPLTAMRTYSENASAFLQRGAQDKVADNLQRITKLTERMASLAKTLTRFARKPNETIGTAYLAELVSEAAELARARMTRSGVTLQIGSGLESWVMGGPVRLLHVVLNLITNAVDAAPDTENGCIWIYAERQQDRIALCVEDNGHGIPPELMPRIFDPFVTTKDVGAGLGLGLSICFNIVRDCGGSLRAEDRPDGGTRFIITLLAAAEDGSRGAASAIPPEVTKPAVVPLNALGGSR